jgi:hypothetical protein
MQGISAIRTAELLWFRISNAIRFYSKQASRCKEPIKGAYFLYLADKKRNQLIVFEKVARNLVPAASLPPENAEQKKAFPAKYKAPAAWLNLSDIHDFAVQICEHELDRISAFMSITDIRPVQRLLSLLWELERDFLSDACIGYLDFIAGEMARKPVEITPQTAYSIREPAH